MIDQTALIFREVQKNDKDLLAAFLVRNNVPKVTETFTAFPMNEHTAIFISETEHKDRFYLLFLGQQVIGLSMLRGFDEGYLIPSFGIMIDHEFQGMGLGKYLLTRTIDEAKSMGCLKVRLSVYASNQAGRKIYEAIGFVEIERSSIQRNHADDEKIIMLKDLL